MPAVKKKAARSVAKRAVSRAWRDLFALLPEYDPVATAGDGQYFDATAAQTAVDFFSEVLVHIEGRFAGDPFVLRPWQAAIVGCLFGWKRADGTRRYRTAFLGVPRGNGKTPLAAGICNYVLFCDREPGAQVYGAAAEANQAGLLFRHARGMVDRSPLLSSRCRVYPGGKSIVLKSDQNSSYRVVSSDAGGKHGYTPHCVLADELHAWQGRDLMEAFDTAFAKRGRRQPLMVIITTRDFDGRESVCNEKWLYAERVRSGVVVDDAFLPVLFAAKDDDDWTAEATWEKCNPNIDVSVDRESLRRFVETAKSVPAKESEFKRLHLNQKTDSNNPWLSLGVWDGCAAGFSLESVEGETCYGGIDLSSTLDITAWVMVFPGINGKVVIVPRFFIPEDGAKEREDRDKVPYRAWARTGIITMTPGNVVDYEFVRQQVLRDRETYNIAQVGADRWNAQQLCTQLSGDGFDVVFVQQTITTLNAPTKELERLATCGELSHGGNPIMRWMVSNAVTETDANGNNRLSKRKSTGRIDGLAAAVNAIACMLAGGGRSAYETESGFVL